MKNWNSVKALMAISFIFFSTTLSADYCAKNEEGEAVGCSLMVNAGDAMQPVLAFVAKKDDGSRTWELGVRILVNDWIQLEGDSDIRIDDGDFETLKYRMSRKAQIKEGLLSESAHYYLSEEMVGAIAVARDQVVLRVSTKGSDPVVIELGSDKLSGLADLLAEARAEL